jgi:hypothetical protein
MKLKYDSAGVSALDMGHLTCQDLYKHRRPTKNVCWSCMHFLFCRSHLYVHKIRTLEVPDGNLPSAVVASHSTVLRILLLVSGGRSRIGDGKARRRLKRAPCPLPAGLLSCFWGLPFPNITNGLLLYQDETARVISRYHFWLSNRSELPLTFVPSCRN